MNAVDVNRRLPLVLVRGPSARRVIERIQAEVPDVEAVTDDELRDPSAVGIVAGHVGDGELTALSNLQWIHSWAAGVDSDVGIQVRGSGVTVTSSAGNGAVPLAEHAMMLMLLLNRDAPRWFVAQRERRWDRFTHDELLGKTVGIYGFGNLGRELAVRARSFGMRVVGLRRDPEKDATHVDRMFAADSILEFAAECDVLVVAAPLTAQTQGAINAAVIGALRPGAHLIVMSRGGIVNDHDALAALRAGDLSAGFDAHAEEPLPRDSPYWALPNVLVTPHNGATTPATAERGIEIFIDNLRRRLSGTPLHNIVDLSVLV